MSSSTVATAAPTAWRVLRQVRRDPRTVALLVVVPSGLLTLVRFAFDDRPEVFDRIGLPLVGIFPLVSMFLVASIAMLRERRSGTLERLMAMPTSRVGLLVGYSVAFGALAVMQSVAVLIVAVGALGLDTEGPVSLAVVVAVANALLGMSMGLASSAFARTEFQVVQFMPAFVLPQFLVCGLLVERSEMAHVLEIVSAALPMTYAYEALQAVATESSPGVDLAVDLAVTSGMGLIALAFGAATLPRRTA